MAKRGRTIDMSDERFAEFLDRLASDDLFRESMERDPAATLVGAGFRVSKESMPKKVKLPSKRELKGKIGSYLERKRAALLDFLPHHLLGEGACGDDRKKPLKPLKPPKPKATAKAPKPKPKAPKGRKTGGK